MTMLRFEKVLKHTLSPTFALFTMLSLITGCASWDPKINLTYSAIGTENVKGMPKILVAKFDDFREDKHVVGKVQNSFGMKFGNVVLQDTDAGKWVENAFIKELKTSGFEVVKIDDHSKAEAAPKISGSISELNIGTSVSYYSSTTIKVQIIKDSVTVLNKEYHGKRYSIELASGATGFEDVAREALQSVMRQAIPDIIKVLK